MCLFIVLVDGLINVILFIVQRDDYISWCTDIGSDGLQPAVGDTRIRTEDDFYNCSRTWEDELKFGLMAILMMIGFYVRTPPPLLFTNQKKKCDRNYYHY